MIQTISRKGLNKEILFELYVNQQMTLFEIAEIFQTTQEEIEKWMDHFSLKYDKKKRKYEIVRKIPISDLQKQVIIGSLLGNGKILHRGKNLCLEIFHPIKQKELILWKKVLLGSLVNVIDKTEEAWSFKTVNHHELNFFYKYFYSNNKKIIQKDLFKYLTPLSLAIWFSDVGKFYGETIRFSTNKFTKEENLILQEILKINFDIRSKVVEYEKNNLKYYFISLNKRNKELFLKLINEFEPFLND